MCVWVQPTSSILLCCIEEIAFHFSVFNDSVQFSRSVMSDSLWPHESQHARPPCLSPTPRVYSNPCPSSRWCHPAISSSVIPFSSCPQSLPASGSFPMREQNMDCYSLNVFIPPEFLCWTLDALCDGGTFARCLGGDGGACRNGTSAFIKKAVAHSTMWGHLEKAPAISRKEGLTKLDRADTFILDFQPPELWEINVWCICVTQCVILCHYSPNGLRYESMSLSPMKQI